MRRAGEGGAQDEACPRCGLHLGDWRDHGERRAFHPNLANVRRLAYGDGWLRFNCKHCDNRITLDHQGRAA